MVRLVIMVIATFFDLVLIFGLLKSGRYGTLVNSFPDSPVKELYGIGFAVSAMKLFGFKDGLLKKLRLKTALIYGEKYAEYYALAALAKALTFIVLLMGILPSLGVILGSAGAVFFLIIALLGSALAWNSCVLYISDETKRRSEVCLAEFPDMVTKFALMINSGMILREAWYTIAYSKNNELYELMKQACDDMDNGVSETDAIYQFGIKTNCQEIRKFTASMMQGITKGNNELAVFLTEQAQEMLEHKRQTLLQKGEKAAGKLLIPIGITFVGIIMIIGVGAMQSMSF